MSDIAQVIEALEKATEGSEVLDREIAKACGVAWSPDEDGNFGGYHLLPRRCHFTRSLDAALTLVPEDAVWHVFTDFCLPGRARVGVGATVTKDCRPPALHSADGTTPALALCIAALKARQVAA